MLKKSLLYSTKSWLLLMLSFIILGNIIFWIFRMSSHQSKQVTDDTPKNTTDPPLPAEAKLSPVMLRFNQPIRQPTTYVPAEHPRELKNLRLVAPTADQITMRLENDTVTYADRTDLWEFGYINSKPDVFIASNGQFSSVFNHYNREHRIYTLMKWILRVYRRDPNRKTPLLMVDVGSSHGLYSVVASVSGAYSIAFEPQIHLRSTIALSARLNQVSSRVRVLPFGVLSEHREVSMTNLNKSADGSSGQLDLVNTESGMQSYTIRIDDIPSYDLLFGPESHFKTSISTPEDISQDYADSLKSCIAGYTTEIHESLTLHHPIHFLKIDVEGFELEAIESAGILYESGMVENTVVEFGPPSSWEVAYQDWNATRTEKREAAIEHAKTLFKRIYDRWDMDIYLLPGKGWGRTVQWLLNRGAVYSTEPGRNQIVHTLKAWNFDDMPKEHDEFELEMEGKEGLVTELIPLRPDCIEDYLEALQSIGKMYVWFSRREGNPAIKEKLELPYSSPDSP